MSSRIIFHVDMNCFFVSCELAKNSSLKGKKIAVAPITLDRKGIILTASYEARKDGVHSAIPVSEALRLSPSLILISPHYDLYVEYSKKIIDYFYTITPIVEQASIDEAFLDVTDCCKPNEMYKLAETMQNYILTELSIPCSIGIGPNKLLAKIGSDYKKPQGITIMRKREVQTLLWPRPINTLLGVGKKSLATLNEIGIYTVGDLVKYPRMDLLKQVIGEKQTKFLLQSANGIGSNVVNSQEMNELSSISNAHTFDHDECDTKNMILLIKVLSNSVSNRLKKRKILAQTITLEIRYNTFKTINRSVSVDNATNDEDQLFHLLTGLFEEYYNSDYPVRLIGVSCTRFQDEMSSIKQLSIFDSLDEEQKQVELNHLLESINSTFGKTLITKGVKKEKL